MSFNIKLYLHLEYPFIYLICYIFNMLKYIITIQDFSE